MIWNNDFPPINLWNYSKANYWDKHSKKDASQKHQKPKKPKPDA